MRALGWSTHGQPNSRIFFRSLGPFNILKIQRALHLDPDLLAQFKKSHRSLITIVEPALTCPSAPGFKVEPYAHSQTSLLDLSLKEANLLRSFTQKTRYNLNHNLKKNLLRLTRHPLGKLSPAQKSAFLTLHSNWSQKKHVIGYGHGLLEAVLDSFAQDGHLSLAYHQDELVGALLTLTCDRVETYYAAFTTPAGNRLYAPTLLTWFSMMQAKKNGCDIFDFGGIFDPRYPRLYHKWLGFTKFKAGFNPEVVSYPPTSLQLFW